MTSRAEKWCTDCDESRGMTSSTLCPVCGSALQRVGRTQEPRAATREELENRFRDLFGDEIFGVLGDVLGNMAPGRKVSTAYFDSLAQVTVDESKSILVDSFLETNGLKLLVTLGSFCQATHNTQFSGRLVLASPECGEEPLAEDCREAIVIIKRGKVSFVSKVLNAQRCGAKAVLIIQSAEKWPFVMTDSANEREKAEEDLCIPSGMISLKDGALLAEMCKPSAKSPRRELEGTFVVGTSAPECSVCREDFETNATVVKLPCRHLYHHECLKAWVAKNNTCPLCRYEMPAS